MVCGACNKTMNLKAGAGAQTDILSCSKCPKKYHNLCVKLSREDHKLIRKNEYACPNCKLLTKTIRNDETPVATQIEPESSEPGCDQGTTSENAAVLGFLSAAQGLAASTVPADIMTAFTSALRQMQEVFNGMKREMTEFTASLNYTSEDIVQFRQELTEMKGQLKELDYYKSEVKTLRAEVSELRQVLEDKEQRHFLKDVEITGLTETNGENLTQVVNVLSNKLGVQLDPRDVDDVRRVAARGGGGGGGSGGSGGAGAGAMERPRPVVLTFTRRAPRDQLIRAARVRRGITTDMLEIAGNSRRVFINEHLTKENRVLFSKARAVGADLKYKFTWTSNCNVFMRRTETSPVLRITSEAMLEKLGKGTPTGMHSAPFQNSSN
ncbi:hypothetical protein JYU34_008416 [Plutella xylostella]|uniref:PHD-type domain-containing protein n=1 Tax=Plutella xylostella TaxID=51655 RepID=A0ABQ7QN04_PLUXY|nr:hypothetical protein JYU34_008416 [Plutella xylostella]